MTVPIIVGQCRSNGSDDAETDKRLTNNIIPRDLPDDVEHSGDLKSLLSDDPLRLQALHAVAQLDLLDCWIAAGFIRDAVWDHRHGFPTRSPAGDVDTVWFNSATTDEATDGRIEEALRSRLPGFAWSVKKQARMHRHNGDEPYASVTDAMRHWPKTATAIAARVGADGLMEINAPFGLDDLFALRIEPTPAFSSAKLPIVRGRLAAKRWLERYPLLTLSDRLRD